MKAPGARVLVANDAVAAKETRRMRKKMKERVQIAWPASVRTTPSSHLSGRGARLELMDHFDGSDDVAVEGFEVLCGDPQLAMN